MGPDVVALREVTEIVPGDPRNVEQRIAAFHGMGAATGVATFRNVPILAVIDYAAILGLETGLFNWLNLHWLCNRMLHRLNLWCLLRRSRPHLGGGVINIPLDVLPEPLFPPTELTVRAGALLNLYSLPARAKLVIMPQHG